MSENKPSADPQSSSASTQGIGSSKSGFGKKKRKSNRLQYLGLAGFLIVAVGGFVWLVGQTRGSGIAGGTTTGLDNKEFDPIADFDVIREEGNVNQLEKLMFDLKLRRMNRKSVPVQLDNASKIVQVAEQLLDHPERTEKQRVFAARSKLDGIWQTYNINLRNKLGDPFIAQQFFAAADEFMNDENELVSRDAFLARARALVYETSYQRSLGSFDAVGSSITDLISNYPEDSVILENIRILFTSLRAKDAENSAKLAGKIAEIADNSEYEGTRKLSRFMKDIIALYDAGIGNAKTIANIMVDDDNFKGRLKQLNSDLDTGETVVTQLDNAIEFFERQRKYDAAAEVSRWVLDNADKRTNPEAAALASKIGKAGLQRNSILEKPFLFEGVEKNGNAIDTDRFEDRVVMIAYFSSQDEQSKILLNSLSNVSATMFGKTVDFVLVEVSDGESVVSTEEFDNSRWVVVKTSQENPNSYLQQCPTVRFPYFVLIDKAGNVDSINLTLRTIKTKIDHLLSKN